MFVSPTNSISAHLESASIDRTGISHDINEKVIFLDKFDLL
ncbi:hypothetical protein L53_12985 [Hyphomonas sp. L-53-1-40]|nr:hypothetical protein L53_12985 [Hyphomonas sp. L-53-1-40]